MLAQLEAEVEGSEEFEDAELRDPLDPASLALGGNWVLHTRLGRFDVMQRIGDDALWGRLSPAAVSAEIGALSVRVVSYEDLVALKQQAGRPEDLTDLQRLSQARGEEP